MIYELEACDDGTPYAVYEQSVTPEGMPGRRLGTIVYIDWENHEIRATTRDPHEWHDVVEGVPS